MSKEATVKQPRPTGRGFDVARAVQSDIEARAQLGIERYGERLRTHNGRNALIDAYQEALDLCMYLKQVLMESQKDD